MGFRVRVARDGVVTVPPVHGRLVDQDGHALALVGTGAEVREAGVNRGRVEIGVRDSVIETRLKKPDEAGVERGISDGVVGRTAEVGGVAVGVEVERCRLHRKGYLGAQAVGPRRARVFAEDVVGLQSVSPQHQLTSERVVGIRAEVGQYAGGGGPSLQIVAQGGDQKLTSRVGGVSGLLVFGLVLARGHFHPHDDAESGGHQTENREHPNHGNQHRRPLPALM